MKDIALAVLLLVAAATITVGLALTHTSAGWIGGGLLLGAWSWLVLSEVDE